MITSFLEKTVDAKEEGKSKNSRLTSGLSSRVIVLFEEGLGVAGLNVEKVRSTADPVHQKNREHRDELTSFLAPRFAPPASISRFFLRSRSALSQPRAIPKRVEPPRSPLASSADWISALAGGQERGGVGVLPSCMWITWVGKESRPSKMWVPRGAQWDGVSDWMG